MNDDVVGIAAIKTGRARSEFVHAYVLPAYRRMRVYASLLDARIAFARNSGILPIKATATEASTHALMKAGFECVGTRGKYALMELRE